MPGIGALVCSTGELRQRLRRIRDGSTSPDCTSASSMNRCTGRERKNPVWPPWHQWISGLNPRWRGRLGTHDRCSRVVVSGSVCPGIGGLKFNKGEWGRL